MVPVRALIIVSIIPITLQFLSFELFLIISSFMIGVVTILQIAFYCYARHGYFGHYKYIGQQLNYFKLPLKVRWTIIICIPPLFTSIGFLIC